MNFKIAFWLLTLWIIPALASACGNAQIATYPNKPITYYICFDPGGPSDREARRQQPIIEEELKQKARIEYKVGGGGAVCWSEVSKAPADGYTIVGINIPHIILQPILQDAGYQTSDLEPIAIFQGTTMGFAVLKDSSYQTLEDLLNDAKSSPEKILVGGVGTFTGHHFATLRLQNLTNSQFTYVPFTGAAQEMPEFLGGHVDAVFANSDDLLKYKNEIRVLAFATENRYPRFPNSPTFKEQNLDLVMGIERGVAVAKGTPAETIQILEAVFMKVANDPAIKEQLVREGYIPIALGHNQSKAYIAKMTQIYSELVNEIQ